MSNDMSAALEKLINGDSRLIKAIEPFISMELNCNQVVLLPYIDHYPADIQDLIMDMTVELGGGVADLGYVCGGLLGAVMAISRGLSEKDYLPEERQEVIDRFLEKFSARYKSHSCSGITGRDTGTEKAFEACRILIVETIKEVDEIFAQADTRGIEV